MYIIGAVATGAFGFLYFALLDTVVPGWIFLAIVLSLIPHDLMYGLQAARGDAARRCGAASRRTRYIIVQAGAPYDYFPIDALRDAKT
jgi:hypothetical protein